jgi:pyrroloquinoline quinone biosynthesis protein D
MDGGTILRFPPHVKFRFDEKRQAWIVLAPERLLLPDEQAVEILKLVDGERSVDAVIDALAEQFDAPRAEIAGDVQAMLQDLIDKKVLQR